jgi:hypothetical protein
MFILRFLLIFFWGVQQVLTFKENKIGRKKFEKNKKQKGIGTSNKILKRHNNNYLFKNPKEVYCLQQTSKMI